MCLLLLCGCFQGSQSRVGLCRARSWILIFLLRNPFQLRLFSDFCDFFRIWGSLFCRHQCDPAGKHHLCLTGGGIWNILLNENFWRGHGTNPSPKCGSGVTPITCVALRWRSLGVLISSGSFIYPWWGWGGVEMCCGDTLFCINLGNAFFWQLGVFLYGAESKILVVDAFGTAGPGKVFYYFTLWAPKLYCCIGSERLKSGKRGTAAISTMEICFSCHFHKFLVLLQKWPHLQHLKISKFPSCARGSTEGFIQGVLFNRNYSQNINLRTFNPPESCRKNQHCCSPLAELGILGDSVSFCQFCCCWGWFFFFFFPLSPFPI